MISEVIEKLKTKKVSCVELVKGYLDSIEKKDKLLNAFITVTKSEALTKARNVDKVISADKDVDSLFKRKPLLGVPIAHKDIFSTEGIETTAGSNILKGYIPPYDATSVKKLKDAGAVILGKLNCDAFAHGTTGENSDFGPTKNPYNLKRVAGGSSSGSAAAVSAGLVPVATATDTGGSIRDPASFTNTVGLKPTYSRVSRYGVIAMASSLDSVGHITETVEDSAKILQITAGYDPLDATSSQKTVPDYLEGINTGVKGLKIGLPKENFGEGIDIEVKNKVMKAIDVYKKLGAQIIDISLPSTNIALAVYYIIVPSEISSNLARFDGIRFGHEREKFGDEAKRRIMMGTYTLSSGFYDAYYLKAQKVRTVVTDDFKKAFKKVDVLIGPAMPMTAPKLGELVNDPIKMYMLDVLTCPVNLAGLPALSVPAGFSKDGLPIGLQIIGNHFEEKLLFKVGKALERETEYRKQKPKETL